MLIAARAVQGTGNGGLITLVKISVGNMFNQRGRGLFYGIYGAVWAVLTAIRPVIGTSRLTCASSELE
jgi:MFS family permease